MYFCLKIAINVSMFFCVLFHNILCIAARKFYIAEEQCYIIIFMKSNLNFMWPLTPSLSNFVHALHSLFFYVISYGVMVVVQTRILYQLQLVQPRLWAKSFLLSMESWLAWPFVCQFPMCLLWIWQSGSTASICQFYRTLVWDCSFACRMKLSYRIISFGQGYRTLPQLQ